MDILHVGYFTDDIESAVKSFELFGFKSISETVKNIPMNCNCRYISNNTLTIELINPIDESSYVYKLYQKLGCGPYHICFKSKCVKDDVVKLKKRGFIVTSSGSKYDEYEKHNFAFLYNLNSGLVEIIEDYDLN